MRIIGWRWSKQMSRFDPLLAVDPAPRMTAMQREQPLARRRPIHTVGQEQSQANGRVEAIQLMNGARLLKRVFDIDMQHCPNCGGGELKIIAAILERPVIEKILTHLGLQTPPPKAAAREPGRHQAG
jgi:hypothetical protein